MHIFVTGATGFIGSVIVAELLSANHTVLGLARSDAAAKQLSEVGAAVHRGSLEDIQSLQSGAASSDGVIHCGFIHDFSKFEENCQIDKRAIEALGEALAGSDRPLVITSGSALLKPGQISSEDDLPPKDSQFPRVSEEAAGPFVDKGVRVSVVRLPPSVHGEGDHGFIPILIQTARDHGEAAYPGEGSNRWPAVHRLDAAVLYRLVVEQGKAGTRYHGIADEGVPFKEIAGVIGKRLEIPVVSKTGEAATNYFGWLEGFASLDCPSTAKKTTAELGWAPKQAGLIEDLDHDFYFKS
jgi:nucleoside-diphosphate-sugar epimerase